MDITDRSNGNDYSAYSDLRCRFCSGFEDKLGPFRVSRPIKHHDRSRDIGPENGHPEALHGNEEDHELMEMQKHEILVKISEILDMGPHGLALAETLFEQMKYEIARYVVLNEFNATIPLSTQLALWLDMKLMPKQKQRIEKVIEHFFGARHLGEPNTEWDRSNI